MDHLEIVDVPAKVGLGIRRRVAQDKIGDFCGECYPRLFMHANMAGYTIAGAPIAIYYTWEDGFTEMACMVPLTRAVEASDDMMPMEVGGCRAVTCIHVGPYEGLAEAHEKCSGYVQMQGHQHAGYVYEEYLNDAHEVGPDHAETLVIWPIR